jgi:Holliday junction resolvase-like predicted endonuclease
MEMIEKHQVGRLGEEIACRYLLKQGFSILARNYAKKWGELDIIAEKANVLHFVEVKTLSITLPNVPRETTPDGVNNVPHETFASDQFRPEDNVHQAKLERMNRTIQSYLAEKHVSCEKNWQIDVISVRLDRSGKKAKVDYLPNVV